MKRKLLKKRICGLTLIEIMVAVAVIAVAAIGAMMFRYYCVLDARKADVQMVAGRVGVLLLESWKGMAGLNTFDPTAIGSISGSGITITSGVSGPPGPSDYTPLNTGYRITANRVNYYATLSYKDATPTAPKMLNVNVAWLSHYQTGTVPSNGRFSVKFTTYLR